MRSWIRMIKIQQKASVIHFKHISIFPVVYRRHRSSSSGRAWIPISASGHCVALIASTAMIRLKTVTRNYTSTVAQALDLAVEMSLKAENLTTYRVESIPLLHLPTTSGRALETKLAPSNMIIDFHSFSARLDDWEEHCSAMSKHNLGAAECPNITNSDPLYCANAKCFNFNAYFSSFENIDILEENHQVDCTEVVKTKIATKSWYSTPIYPERWVSSYIDVNFDRDRGISLRGFHCLVW